MRDKINVERKNVNSRNGSDIVSIQNNAPNTLQTTNPLHIQAESIIIGKRNDLRQIVNMYKR